MLRTSLACLFLKNHREAFLPNSHSSLHQVCHRSQPASAEDLHVSSLQPELILPLPGILPEILPIGVIDSNLSNLVPALNYTIGGKLYSPSPDTGALAPLSSSLSPIVVPVGRHLLAEPETDEDTASGKAMIMACTCLTSLQAAELLFSVGTNVARLQNLAQQLCHMRTLLIAAFADRCTKAANNLADLCMAVKSGQCLL